MKVMVRRNAEGVYSVYVPKKDLEEPIVGFERDSLFGGTVTLANGMVLELPEIPAGQSLPLTVEARKVSG
ncbi:putative nitrogen fixation protein NifT [Leptospirillum ferriphilum]|jgi:nitrogen fixation protein NifT|uniref:Protein fixU n=1 Tax=Leptospirillum ferriphilum YSK TaxID=1441628 RepID=A0A059Y045_9BACT|nr:putative nitrogen fixation protein NifT [Leptospirillum ferriphilum]AIA30827.1 protein fixU [Leptospirillum ferriphilum YSK]OOH77280.1 putative nitrogen fixation protein NifT [Leptospirillum ferriphilum]